MENRASLGTLAIIVVAQLFGTSLWFSANAAFEDLARRAQDEFESYDQTRNDEGFGAAPGAVDGDPYVDDI